MKIQLFCAIIALILCSGCGTVFVHSDDNPVWPPHPYNGVTFDCQNFYIGVTGPPEYRVMSFQFFDIPFSFVGDTFCVPYDIYIYSEYHMDYQY